MGRTIITVENVNTGEWFVAHVHDTYGLGSQWVPCSVTSHFEQSDKEIVEDLLKHFDQDKLIPTPPLPLEEEYQLLSIYNKIVINRDYPNYDDYRRKIQLIVRDREITGKSFLDARNTVEAFLKYDAERKNK